MYNVEPPNTGSGDPGIAWLGRMILKSEATIDKLADRIEGLREAIANDMKDMREGFHREVETVENRVSELNDRIIRLEQANKILAILGTACLIGFVGLAIPKLFGPAQQPPAVERAK